MEYFVIKIDSSAGSVTVLPQGMDTINGSTAGWPLGTAQYSQARFRTNAAATGSGNWIVSGNSVSSGLAQPGATVVVGSGVATVDISNGATIWTLQPTANITSWSFPTLPASGKYAEFTIIFQQNATSAKTVVSPATTGHTAGSLWSPSAVLGSYQSLGIRLWSSGTVELFPSAVMV